MQNSGQRESVAPGLVSFAGSRVILADELRAKLRNGFRCVRFEYCVSFLIATVRRQSAVYLTASWQERYLRGLGYSLLAVLLGPWGVPWGLIWTPWAVWTNLTGGIDVTGEIATQFGGESAVPSG
jgi:hypothetical protein